jgi:hypothetical protein
LITSDAADVIAFARLHSDGGVAPDGTRLLSARSVRAMQEPQVEVLDRWRAAARGLGWTLYRPDGSVVGHDGGTIGQLAFLRVAPERRFAVCLLTNGWTGGDLFGALVPDLFGDRLGIGLPTLPDASAKDVAFDAAALSGRYERAGTVWQIEPDGSGLVASIEYTGVLAGHHAPVERAPLRTIDATSFLVDLPGATSGTPLIFFDFDDAGRPQYFHSGGRTTPRVD